MSSDRSKVVICIRGWLIALILYAHMIVLGLKRLSVGGWGSKRRGDTCMAAIERVPSAVSELPDAATK